MILKSKCYGNLQLWNWRQRSKSRCERIHRGNPSNRTLIVQKLTDEAPAAPESVYGLEPLKMCSNVLNQQLTYATWMRKVMKSRKS